jgi:hypothetical protein
VAQLALAQVLSALPRAILGIPLGLLLFKAAVHDGSLASTLVPWLAVALFGTLIAMAGLTVVPAMIIARQSVAEVLQSEAT